VRFFHEEGCGVEAYRCAPDRRSDYYYYYYYYY